MTIEADDILQQYTIGGIGPYPVTWPYLTGGLVVSVDIAGIVTALDPADFTADPAEGASGNVFLTAPAAATHTGRQLFITRETPAEQGWQGVLGERERGLEAQLDRIVMLVQELRQLAASSLRIQGAAPQPAYVTGAGVLMWDGTTLDIGPDASEIEAAQAQALAAAASAANAAASAAAAATFNPGLYLTKSGNFAGLANVMTALTSGLGFSSYMAGLRGTADLSALWAALGLGSIAARSSLLFSDIAAAAVRLSSEGYSTPTDTELATTAWAKGYTDGQALGVGQTRQNVAASRAFNTSYQNTTGRPIQVSMSGTSSSSYTVAAETSANGINWVSELYLPTASYPAGQTLLRGVIVPAGHYYRITGSGSLPTFNWVELR